MSIKHRNPDNPVGKLQLAPQECIKAPRQISTSPPKRTAHNREWLCHALRPLENQAS